MKMILVFTLMSFCYASFATTTRTCWNNDCESEEFTDGKVCSEQTEYTHSNRPPECAQNGQGRQGQGQNNSSASTCYNSLKTKRAAWLSAYKAAAAAATTPVTPAMTSALTNAYDALNAESDCRSLEIMSQAVGFADIRAADTTRTIDGRATCIQKGGFTADYDSCKSTAGAYNAIIALEKVMLTQQAQRSQSNQQNLQSQAAAQAASGDAQNAAFDATIADTQFKKGLDNEQVMAYSAAVALLGSKLMSWQKSSQDALEKLCGSKPIVPTGVSVDQLNAYAKTPPVSGATVPNGLTPDIAQKYLPANFTNCKKGVDTANSYDAREIIANNSAKSAFALALTEFFSKAAQAKLAADRLKAIGNAVAAAKTATATGANGAPGFVNCAATPKAPSCIKIGDRVNANGISQGNFSAGEGFGNNSFDTGATTAGSTGTEVAGTGPSANVGNMTSPFNDQAKAANQILDPAKAASITPTGGSGGGGGGVGGGLGGGGVSLGNDLSGADKNGNKTKDIEANKLSGSYSGAGGKGFSALAANKEDNPFASLFDSKSQGGLEEDRSIASDSGGTDSGIFQKISRRYEQVQSDKRIEANNLE
jgi:hypothetical protein